MWGFFGNDLPYMGTQIYDALQGDVNYRFEGEADFIAPSLNLPAVGPYPGIGPWSPREAARNATMDTTEAAVWSDYASEHGAENLAIDYLELAELKKRLK